jgi:hypothetical protein
MMNMRVVGAAAAALSLSAPAWGQTCTIVTNGELHVYQHELAHCNGWTHKPFERGVNPPLDWVHPFKGKLTVYLTGDYYVGIMDTMNYAQPSAEFIIQGDKTVPELCKAFWLTRGIIATAKEVDEIIGCQM